MSYVNTQRSSCTTFSEVTSSSLRPPGLKSATPKSVNEQRSINRLLGRHTGSPDSNGPGLYLPTQMFPRPIQVDAAASYGCFRPVSNRRPPVGVLYPPIEMSALIRTVCLRVDSGISHSQNAPTVAALQMATAIGAPAHRVSHTEFSDDAASTSATRSSVQPISQPSRSLEPSGLRQVSTGHRKWPRIRRRPLGARRC